MESTSPKAQIQKDKALKVHKLMLTNPGMTQAAACAEVGIDPKTFRKWIAQQDEALEAFEKTLVENERLEYASYLVNKLAITDQFIKDALRTDLSVTERIKALEYIEERFDELRSQYHPVDIEVEKDLLSGPNQEMGVSNSAKVM